MSFGGRGGGGGFRGGGGRGFGRGRGGGGFNRGDRGADLGPPEQVMHFCHFLYKCQSDLVCKADISDVPYFNAPVYLENKQMIGKIDEIFGRVTEYCVTVRPSEGISADTFNEGDKLYLDPNKILPLSRFTHPDNKKGGRGGRGGGGRGGRGGFGGRGRGGGFGGRGGGGFGGRGGGGFGGRGGGGGFGGRGGGGFGGRGGGGFGGRGGGGRGGGGGFSRGGGRGSWS